MKQKLKDHVVINKKNLIKLLTKCAKMTEEGGDLITRNGMNGTSAGITPLRQSQAIQLTLAGQRNSSIIENQLHGGIFQQKDIKNSSNSADATSADRNESVESNLINQKNKGSSANESDNSRTKVAGKTIPTTSSQSVTGGASNDRTINNTANNTTVGGRLQFFKGEFYTFTYFQISFFIYSV